MKSPRHPPFDSRACFAHVPRPIDRRARAPVRPSRRDRPALGRQAPGRLLAALAMAVWLARGVTEKLVAVSLGFIMGGAVSNAIDRLVLGGVADFFSLHAYGFYWYVFNIADVAIVAGVCGLLYDSLSPSRNRASKSP